LTYIQDSIGTVAPAIPLARWRRRPTPDGSQYNFEYNASPGYLTTSVTHAQGKTIESHSYDSNARGLTSQRANRVDSVTVSYPAFETQRKRITQTVARL
jgi:hypothetical protein